MAATVVGRDAHFDAPLTNFAVKAFQGSTSNIATRIFPVVNVAKQSNKYYTIDKDSWLLVPDTARAPGTAPRHIEFKISSDSYFANNYALAEKLTFEDLSNADSAIQLRTTAVEHLTDGLLRDLEVRVANKITSGSNLGSYTTLTGTAQWSDFANSSPMSDVTTAHAFIRSQTGLKANVAITDPDTLSQLRRHTELLDMFKYTSGGMLDDNQLRSVLDVEEILVGTGIKNTAIEGAAASNSNIWGNNFILAKVQTGVSLTSQTYGLSFRWRPEGVGTPMTVRRYNDADVGKMTEIIDVGYYQDEKIVAQDLSYGILSTV